MHFIPPETILSGKILDDSRRNIRYIATNAE